MYNNIIKRNIASISLFSLIAFLFFDYILRFTVYQSQDIIFVWMYLNLFLFIACFMKYKKEPSRYSLLWMFFLIPHIFSYLVAGNLANVFYWVICLLILLIPSSIVRNFSPRLLLYIGIFFIVGVFFQMLFPSLYMSYVFPKFIGSASDFINSSINYEFGFSGFSYQTGTTAFNLLICEAILLSYKSDFSSSKAKVLHAFILGLVIGALFLTGKRMPSAISIVLLIAYMYKVGASSARKRLFLIVAIVVAFYFLFILFINNVETLSDNIFLRRLASSITSSEEGEDISSGRDILYRKAYQLFLDNPILGIGAGNFAQSSGMRTDVHNSYLQVLCEEGIFGLILYIIPLFIVFIKSWNLMLKNNIKSLNNILLCSVLFQIIYILYSLSANTNANTSNFMIYFLGVVFFIYADMNKRIHSL